MTLDERIAQTAGHTVGAIAFGLLPDGWHLACEPCHGWGIATDTTWVIRPNGAAPMSKAGALVAALEAAGRQG